MSETNLWNDLLKAFGADDDRCEFLKALSVLAKDFIECETPFDSKMAELVMLKAIVSARVKHDHGMSDSPLVSDEDMKAMIRKLHREICMGAFLLVEEAALMGMNGDRLKYTGCPGVIEEKLKEMEDCDHE